MYLKFNIGLSKTFMCFFVAFVVHLSVHGQTESPSIPVQFSGYVLDDTGRNPVSGAHLYVPKFGRGTTADFSGYFSAPLLPGDSLIVTAVGFKSSSYVIPKTVKESLIVTFELESDIIQLESVTVMPYLTEEQFKLAVLAVNLPENNVQRSLYNEELINLASAKLNSDAQSSFQNYQALLYRHDMTKMTGTPTALQAVTNPIAWYSTVKAIKRGDFSKRKKRAKNRKNRYESYSD